MNLLSRTKNIVNQIEILAKISENKSDLTRTYGSAALEEANTLVVGWMQEAGLQVNIDNIGNVRGQLISKAQPAQTLVIGSHLDTVKNAGKFDGALGFLIALDVVAQLKRSKQKLPFNIELVGFCDEEGVRFTTTYLGSSVLSNTFQNSWLDIKDDAGIQLREVIEQNGRNPAAIASEGLCSANCLGYYEVHIEQGPVLEKEQIPVGIVTSIAGQTRLTVRFKGKAGHAGTTPMCMRQDALCAAARFITAVEEYANASDKPMVATVGKLITLPNAPNVIAGEVCCSLDVRSPYEAVMHQAIEDLEGIARKISEKKNISLSWEILQQNKPTNCDSLLGELLENAILKAGITKVIKLPSGAGHDAVALANIMPVSLLFVQCKDGISHHPDEFVKFEDIQAALLVSENFITELLEAHHSSTKVADTIKSTKINL